MAPPARLCHQSLQNLLLYSSAKRLMTALARYVGRYVPCTKNSKSVLDQNH